MATEGWAGKVVTVAGDWVAEREVHWVEDAMEEVRSVEEGWTVGSAAAAKEAGAWVAAEMGEVATEGVATEEADWGEVASLVAADLAAEDWEVVGWEVVGWAGEVAEAVADWAEVETEGVAMAVVSSAAAPEAGKEGDMGAGLAVVQAVEWAVH